MNRFSNKTKAIAAGVLLLAAMALVYIYSRFDPASAGFFPRCIFLTLTGWQCPGCGSQRAIHALLHADIPAAWSANPMVVLLLPFIIAVAWSEAAGARCRRLRRALTSVPVIVAVVILLTAFAIARNQ